MNQPPSSQSSQEDHMVFAAESRPPAWKRPAGVAVGTWDYVHQRSIADRYDQFVADAAMQMVEQQWLAVRFPPRPVVKMGERSAKKTHRVIDLGCGTGRTAIPLAHKGYEVFAVDLSESMLARLAEKSAMEHLDQQIHPIRANLVQLDGFSEGTIDAAVCLFATLGMIQFRRHRREVLRHVHRIVRSGGRFCFHIHHRWATLREPGGFRKLVHSWGRSWFDSEHEFGDSTYAYRGLDRMFMHGFSCREIQQDLRATGWQLESIQRLSIDGKRLTGRWPICGGFLMDALKVDR